MFQYNRVFKQIIENDFKINSPKIAILGLGKENNQSENYTYYLTIQSAIKELVKNKSFLIEGPYQADDFFENNEQKYLMFFFE